MTKFRGTNYAGFCLKIHQQITNYTSCNLHFQYFIYYVVHGGWSSWTVGKCSKTCGGGIVRRTRTCNNPTPSCRGLPCRGISIHEEACNEHCCRGM